MAQSWPSIILLATKSGIPFTVISTFRRDSRTDSGELDYHSSGQAVDFGGYSQDSLAQYFMQFDTLEVIHLSDATGTVYGSKNNKPYAPGSNQTLLQEHRNHLHVAMTSEQTQAALAGTGKNPNTPNTLQQAGAFLKSLPNPLDPAATLVDAFRPFAVATTALTKPLFWRRAAMFLVGSTLVLLGLLTFLRRPFLNKVDEAKQAVSGVVGTGVQGAAFAKGASVATGGTSSATNLPGGIRTTATVGPRASSIPATARPAIKGPPKPPPAVAPVTAVLPPSKGGLVHSRIQPRSPYRTTAEVAPGPRPLPNPSRLSADQAIERMTNPTKRKKR